MIKKKISKLILAVTVANLISTPVTAFAEEAVNKNTNASVVTAANNEKTASVNKFGLFGSKDLEAYNKKFKVDRSEIKSISNNGGRYSSSYIENAIDGNFNTHWETGKPNDSKFTNEVVLELYEVTELNRIVYGARQESAKGKGFAQKFEVYASTSESGEDFQLVAKGSYNGSVSDIVEIKFEPTEFRRIKFKFVQANQDWASASEFALYKQDSVSEKMERLFIDGTMSQVAEEFRSESKIEELAEAVKNHPLSAEFASRIELAKKVVESGDALAASVFELEPRGNSINIAAQKRLWRFQDWQPTGYSVKAGDKITVYVDAKEGEPLPYLVFKQMEAQNNGTHTINLKRGKNEVTIPDIRTSTGVRNGVAAAGVLYTVNPYTKEEQSVTPKLRIEGAGSYPHFIKGVDNDEQVMKELEEYVAKLNADSSLPDVFEIFGDKTLVNVKATYALKWYKDNNKMPSYTASKYDEVLKESLDFWGLDGSSELHSDFNFRYVNMLKNLDGGGFMNAGNGITGFNTGSQGGALNVDMGWGFAHEMGHNFDSNDGSIVEVTNNMLSLYWQYRDKQVSKITNQGLWENKILPKVALENNAGKEYYPKNDYSSLTHIAPLFQLQMYDNNFWPEFMKQFRERKFSRNNYDEIHDAWVTVACDVMKLDLTEHFERHGMVISSSVKEYASKYKKPEKKLWYLNDKYYTVEGGAFTDQVSYEITSTNIEGNNVRLNFSINEEDALNKLGFEILRDGEVVGFTAENTFLDKNVDTSVNHKYEIAAYDKEINPYNSKASANLFASKLSCEKKITVGLHNEFNPLDYVKAENYLGQSIKGSVVILENTVDISKRGTYKVVYGIENEEVTQTAEVEVVSAVDYLSEIKEKSAKVGWKTLGKNTSPGGNPITLYKDGAKVSFSKGLGAHASSEVVYDIAGKGYNTFKAFAGIDGEVNVGSGLASFEVYADGRKIYDSGNVKCGQDYKEINLDITGVKVLKLVTTDGGNGITADNTVWADAKLISNSSAPVITAESKMYKLGESVDIMGGVSAKDIEDGNLTEKVDVKYTDYEKGKAGNFTVIYEVTDSDNNTTEKTVNITVYKELEVSKSIYGQFENLEEYNNEFKIPVSSISNNGGRYSSSTIDKAIDGKPNVHWETGKPNSADFKNEVVFAFDELKSIDKMAYKARSGGKGFVKKFDIYVSETADGNDFYKAGEGSYNGSINDTIEIDLGNIQARRVKFVFIEAHDSWASIGEMSFYSRDNYAHIIKEELFTDSTKESVSEKYNTLEKIDNLRQELMSHPGYKYFEESLKVAEEVVRKDFPTLNVPKDVSVKVGSKADLDDEYSASDRTDGDLTERVTVEGLEDVNYNKPGKYEVTYSVEDNDGNRVTEVRNVYVVDMNDYKYVSDTEWKSTHNTYGKFKKDDSHSGNGIRLTGENGQEVSYEKGLGSHATATVVYDLTKINAQYFTSYVGVDRSMYHSGASSISFEAYVDGKKVYDSGLMRSKDVQKFVEIDLAGAKELKLVITDGGNGIGSDHGNWADAKFHFADENNSGINTSELDNLLEETSSLEESSFTEESWKSFSEARKAAQDLLKKTYDQKKVDDAYDALRDAYEELVKVEAEETEAAEESKNESLENVQEESNETAEIQEEAKKEIIDNSEETAADEEQKEETVNNAEAGSDSEENEETSDNEEDKETTKEADTADVAECDNVVDAVTAE